MKRVVYELDSEPGTYVLYCPGCGNAHKFSTTTPNQYGAKWSFNQDFYFPTFSPSILTVYRDSDGKVTYKCHASLEAGRWKYLDDCTHEHAGKTLDAEPF